MLAEFKAIKAHLEGIERGYPVHLFYAEAAAGEDLPPIGQVPYIVLEHGYGDTPSEMVLGATSEIEFDLRVRVVAALADAVPVVAARVRQRLAPGYGPARVPLEGRVLEVEYVRTEVASQVDRDVTFPQTNSHPAWGVTTYAVHSQPA